MDQGKSPQNTNQSPRTYAGKCCWQQSVFSKQPQNQGLLVLPQRSEGPECRLHIPWVWPLQDRQEGPAGVGRAFFPLRWDMGYFQHHTLREVPQLSEALAPREEIQRAPPPDQSGAGGGGATAGSEGNVVSPRGSDCCPSLLHTLSPSWGRSTSYLRSKQAPHGHPHCRGSPSPCHNLGQEGDPLSTVSCFQPIVLLGVGMARVTGGFSLPRESSGTFEKALTQPEAKDMGVEQQSSSVF